jgi:hypothetical protein
LFDDPTILNFVDLNSRLLRPVFSKIKYFWW